MKAPIRACAPGAAAGVPAAFPRGLAGRSAAAAARVRGAQHRIQAITDAAAKLDIARDPTQLVGGTPMVRAVMQPLQMHACRLAHTCAAALVAGVPCHRL